MTVGAALSDQTGFLLRLAYVKSAACARACISEDAKPRDIAILSTLAEHGPMSQRELGDVMHVNRSVMVKLVDAVEHHGWVVRERSESDRRSYALKLTALGKDALGDLHSELDEGEAELTAALSQAERRRVNQLLRRLIADDGTLGIAMLADRSSYLIARAHRLLRERATEQLQPLGIDPRGFGIISIIDGDRPCSQQHLASRLGISAPAVLQFVDELEKAGLVLRTRDPDDRRVHDLRLTQTGEACLAAAQATAARLQARVVDRLGVRGDRELRGLLGKIIDS